MITIDFNRPLINLDGKEIEGSNIGKIIGNVLVSGVKGDALKFYTWANLFYNGNTVKIDKSDFNALKDFIENSEVFTILLKAQALNILEKYKEEITNQ